MYASSVVELPFPKIDNEFSHHISKGTFAIVGGCEVMSGLGRGPVCRSILNFYSILHVIEYLTNLHICKNIWCVYVCVCSYRCALLARWGLAAR